MGLKERLFIVKKWFHLENFVTCMGVFGNVAVYVQAITIFYLHSAHTVSLLAYLIGFFSMSVWLLYGLLKGIRPLIIANLFGLVGTVLVIFGILKYW